MRPQSAPVWWKRRPLQVAGLVLAIAGAWAVLATSLSGPAALGPVRSTYEGRGGTARWEGAAIALPDLAVEPASRAAPAAVLRLRGRPWSAATALLGTPSIHLAGGIEAWPSAVALAHPEPQQWPVAHVAVRRGRDGAVAAVALLGSLGRVLESDPGEPGYESDRANTTSRSDQR